MNNENRHPNHLHTRPYSPQQNINHRLATLLVILATFQQKIEILRVKLSGHPNFSPQLYYKQIDRMEKGYIDTQDIMTFIKKSKPTFNIDHRYLKSLFVKLNNNDKQNQPKDRLTYFGYLNIIKPYFDNKLARDLLLRDSIAIGTEIDLVAKKLLEDLICTLYACVAEHERAKQLMILGDLQQGGSHQGTLYNIYQILDIIKNNAALSQQTSIPHILTNQILSVPQSQSNIRSQVSISQHIQTNRTSKQRLSYQSILDIFYKFICNTSQYQINREDMKYLLAYLMCHEHMITQQKYLTQLFMPVTSKIQISGIGSNIRVKTRDNPNRNYFKEIQIQSQKILPSQMNFLTYVHPNSISRQAIQLRKKSQNLITNKSARQNPQIKIHTVNNSHKQIIDQQPRTLVNGNNSTIKTPILQKFLRQSKVLKNMSRYQPYQVNQQQSEQQSAFVQQSNYLHVPPQTDNKNIKISNRNNNSLKYITEMNNLDHHKPKQITKDFNIQQVLTNSNLHRSQYYQNLSLRANIKDQLFQESERKHMPRNANLANNLQQSGILSQFMKR